MKLLDGVTGDASISDDGQYRYALSRWWYPEFGVSVRAVLWLMLNPSTADAATDDWTIRRVQGFCRSWGYSGAVVANLFALRSSSPAALYRHPDPVGPLNDALLTTLAESPRVGLVVAAWGSHGSIRDREKYVCELFAGANRDVHALGLTKGGHPRHPRGIRSGATPVLWKEASP